MFDRIRRCACVALAVLVVQAAAGQAEAQTCRWSCRTPRFAYRVASRPYVVSTQVATVVVASPTVVQPQPQSTQPAVSQVQSSGGDFGSWLNGVRAQYNLPAVAHDANLDAWAQQNNLAQAARGLGHFVMGPARRQNSAMGNYESIGVMWLNSPGHRSALLDPSITRFGLAGMGMWWTFNAQ